MSDGKGVVGHGGKGHGLDSPLLRGIIDAPYRPRVGISIDGQGDQLVLNVDYDEAMKRVMEADPEDWLEWDTFIWGGSKSDIQTPFKYAIRAKRIVGITNYTTSMWEGYVLTQQARVQSQAQSRVPVAMPHHG